MSDVLRPAIAVDAEVHAGVSNTSSRFLMALDQCDFDAFVDSFTPEGRWEIKDRPVIEGRDGFQRFWDNRSPKAPQRLHLMNGLCILEYGNRTARVEIVVSIIDLVDGAIIAAGSSTDDLRLCEDGIWRYLRKQTGMRFKNL